MNNSATKLGMTITNVLSRVSSATKGVPPRYSSIGNYEIPEVSGGSKTQNIKKTPDKGAYVNKISKLVPKKIDTSDKIIGATKISLDDLANMPEKSKFIYVRRNGKAVGPVGFYGVLTDKGNKVVISVGMRIGTEYKRWTMNVDDIEEFYTPADEKNKPDDVYENKDFKVFKEKTEQRLNNLEQMVRVLTEEIRKNSR